MRLAVGLGGESVRLASVGDRLSSRRVLPVPPGSGTVPPTDLLRSAFVAARAALDGSPADELVLVHPTHWSAAQLRLATDTFAPLAAVVRTCPAALAVARECHARSPLAPGPFAVLEIRPAGIGITVLADLAGGPPLAGRHAARAERPAELLATAARVAGLAPAELTGGTVLSPGCAGGDTEALVEELTDLVGEPPVLVSDPAVDAVLGALRPAPARPLRLPDGRADARSGGRRGHAAEDLGAGLLVTPRPRRLGPVLCGVGLPVLAALLTILLVHPVGRAREVAEQVRPEGVLVQYDYALRLPEGWQHSGGMPQRRRTLLTPSSAPDGSDLISVEQTVLGYDGTAERDRAFAEFRDTYQRAEAGGSALREFTLGTRVAGRDVIAYRQRQPLRGADVDWYVLFERDAQLSVGCQHTPSGAQRVRRACAEVIGSLHLHS